MMEEEYVSNFIYKPQQAELTEEYGSSKPMINWFEGNDGEIFTIQQINIATNEILDEIVMEREIAINMAINILQILSSNYTTLPPTR